MKGTIVGVEPVSYTSKKDGKHVSGARLFMTVKSNNVIGCKIADEFLREGSSVYKPIAEYLSNNVDDLIGAGVVIDYNVEERAGNTYKEICDLEIILKPKPAKAAEVSANA